MNQTQAAKTERALPPVGCCAGRLRRCEGNKALGETHWRGHGTEGRAWAAGDRGRGGPQSQRTLRQPPCPPPQLRHGWVPTLCLAVGLAASGWHELVLLEMSVVRPQGGEQHLPEQEQEKLPQWAPRLQSRHHRQPSPAPKEKKVSLHRPCSASAPDRAPAAWPWLSQP